MPAHSLVSRIARMNRSLAGRAVNLILPHRCCACARVLAAAGALCTDCWNGMTFIGTPHCHCCGYPFELGESGTHFCNQCLDHRPLFDQARAALVYDDASRELLLAFKHGDRTDLAPHLAPWLRRLLNGLEARPDLIAPIPLHPRRLFQRRFNQAALLAGHLAKDTGTDYDPALIRRVRATASQGHLSRTQRLRNMKGAFALNRGRSAKIRGRSVLLVDDVLTTGATAGECARVLKAAGAARVDLVTLARALRPQTGE